MSSVFGQAWDTVCYRSQGFLERHSPVELPGGIVNSIGKSFVWSFLATSILSGGNLTLGVIGGGLGALAATVNVVARAALQQIQNGLSRWLGKPKEPLALEGRIITDLTGVAAALACAAATVAQPLFTLSLLICGVISYVENKNAPNIATPSLMIMV